MADFKTIYMNISVNATEFVTLPCSTSVGLFVVSWQYRQSESANLQHVHLGLTADGAGTLKRVNDDYSLTIETAKVNDSGWYYCIDKTRGQPLYIIWLTIRIG